MLLFWVILNINFLNSFNFIFFNVYIVYYTLAFVNRYRKQWFIKNNNIFFSYIKLNNLIKFNKIFLNYLKEGLYIDILQKLNFNKFLIKFIYISTQLFNLNYLNNYIIKFLINNIIIYNLFLINNTEDINLNQILFNILIFFIIIWQFIYIYYLNIYLLI